MIQSRTFGGTNSSINILLSPYCREYLQWTGEIPSEDAQPIVSIIRLTITGYSKATVGHITCVFARRRQAHAWLALLIATKTDLIFPVISNLFMSFKAENSSMDCFAIPIQASPTLIQLSKTSSRANVCWGNWIVGDSRILDNLRALLHVAAN